MSNLDTVKAFYAAWSEGDIDGALAHCADDMVWDNVPMKAFVGKERIKSFLEKFAQGMSDTHYDIKNTIEQDNRLMIEGVENYNKAGKAIAVPYMASFHFANGKIASMSDYFDLSTVERQLGIKS